MKKQSSICHKCTNKILCTLQDKQGASKYFINNKEQISFQYSVNCNYENKIILVAQTKDAVVAKETMCFAHIHKDTNINILSKAAPYIKLRCLKCLAMKQLRKEGVKVKKGKLK